MKKIFYYLYLGGLIAGPIVLMLLPANFFDSGQTVCLSVLLLNVTCWGCGITRAVQHFIHFDFTTAFEYNKLVIVVVPLLIWVWAQEVIRLWKRIKLLS